MTPLESELFKARRRMRNIALGVLLGGFALLFFGITIVRMIK